MSKLKSTKPICYRWYKILAGIAICLICILTWIFIVNPLLTWDKQFTVNLIKKLSGSSSNEIIKPKDFDNNIKNLTVVEEKNTTKNTTNFNNNFNETKSNTSNTNISSNLTTSFFLKTTKKPSTKTFLLTTTKIPLQVLFKTSTFKTPILNYTKNWSSTSKIHHKSFNYTANKNVFKTILSSTTQRPYLSENKNNYFNKKINISKTTNNQNQKSLYNGEKNLNIIRNGKLLLEELTKKEIIILHTTTPSPSPPPTITTITTTTTSTTSTYSTTKNNIKISNDQRELLLLLNNKTNYATKTNNEVTNYSKMKNQLNNSFINKLSTKILYPQDKTFSQTTISSTIPKNNNKTFTSHTLPTIIINENLLSTNITTLKLSTTTPIITSTVRSQLYANDNNLKNKNSEENIKNDKKKLLKNNAPVIVTALLDIGRGEWHSFYRPFETYLNSFLDLLQMDNNMIIYGDKTVINFVKKHFKNKIDDKLLLEISMKDLPFYRYRSEMQQIIDNEQKNWNTSWDKRMKNHPESMYADYNILVNSKPYFLYNASIISPFSSDVFIWIDAGYSHGDSKLIPKYTWDPFLIPNKVHIIKLTPSQDQISRYTYERVYRKDISVISAGFIGATRGVINRFYNFFYKTFIELLDDKKVDDDQTVILITIKNYASLFYVIHGGWFDAFRLLPNLDENFDKEELRLRYNPRLYRNIYPYWKIHNNSTRDKILN